MRTLLLVFLSAGLLLSQPLTSTTPDVQFNNTFSACSSTGSSSIYVGGNNPVDYLLTFYTDGANFTAASVGIQGAPAATGGVSGTPGSWTSSTGITITSGAANPIASAAQGTVSVRMYYPWVRVLCSSVTGSGGTVYFSLSGWRDTSGGGGVTPVNPITVQSNCQNSSILSTPAIANLSGSGNTRVITGASGKSIHLCSLVVSTIAAEDIKLTQGTGTNCGTGTADASGLNKSILTWSWDTLGSFIGTSGADLCVNQSVAQATGVTATYYLQ